MVVACLKNASTTAAANPRVAERISCKSSRKPKGKRKERAEHGGKKEGTGAGGFVYEGGWFFQPPTMKNDFDPLHHFAGPFVLDEMKSLLRSIPLVLAAAGGLCAPVSAQSVAVALSEMQTLAQAEDVCALDTGLYVSLETLNDLSSTPNPASRDNVLADGGTYAVETWRGAFRPGGRMDLVNRTLAWGGPYVTFQSGRTQETVGPYDFGSPLDPWGTPYWFYSPLGLLRGDTGTVTLEGYGDQFGRYTIVSFGPDGIKSGDDLTYQFGPGLSSFALSSLKGIGVTPPPAPNPAMVAWEVASGGTITLRGVNLGSTQGIAQVMLGGIELIGVSRWTDREVDVAVPVGLTASGPLFIQRGSQQSTPLQVNVAPPAAGVAGWEGY